MRLTMPNCPLSTRLSRHRPLGLEGDCCALCVWLCIDADANGELNMALTTREMAGGGRAGSSTCSTLRESIMSWLPLEALSSPMLS